MTLYAVAGLGTQIDLPVPLVIHLLPFSQEKRPGIKRQTPGYWVQHETANYNQAADAAMHDRWLHNLTGTYLSFHFCVDDKVIYQFVPVDEITYQAADGAGPGNMSGISSELCVNADCDWTVARHNAAALAGGVMKAIGMGVDRVKRHYDFNQDDPDRHYCPKEMMTEGYWPTFVAHVGTIIGGMATVPPAINTYPLGMDDGIARMLFGEATGDDGKVYRYDPKGTISTAWRERGQATGMWPSLVAKRDFDTRTYFVFSDGWVLWRAGKKGYGELK